MIGCERRLQQQRVAPGVMEEEEDMAGELEATAAETADDLGSLVGCAVGQGTEMSGVASPAVGRGADLWGARRGALPAVQEAE